jgi:hypothetical protein
MGNIFYSCILLGIGLFTPQAKAYDTNGISPQITFNVGSVMSTFAENESQLETTDGTTGNKTEAASGSSSSMSLDVMFEYFNSLKTSFFIRGMGPVVGTTPDRYFSVVGGMNYYFGGIGSKTVFKDQDFEFKIVPKVRYYAGGSLGLGYLTYNTKSATKGDILLEIGGQGGILYPISPKWAMRGELGLAKSVGVLVSSTEIKILIGATTTLGPE